MGKAGRQKRPLTEIAIIDEATISAIAAQVTQTGGYTHPFTHPATMITEDTDHQFITTVQKNNLHDIGSDNQDLSNLVVKITGSSLVADSEIAKIHSHLNSATLDAVTAALTTELKTNYDTAYSHSQTAHAPSNAQKNSDITKAEIESKLTGVISSHSHSGGADPFMAKLILAADKPTGANTTPVTLGMSFDYEANSKYIIDMYMLVAPTAATTGCGFMIDTSSVVTYAGTFASHQLANTGTISGSGSIGDMGATAQGYSSGMPNTNSNFVYGGGILITGANTGTATFFFRSETTAVTTCKAGSIIRVMKI